MKRYISMYLKVAPETFDRMQSNLRDQNWTDLAINAHSLKPQVEYMGIPALKDVLVAIETRVKEGDVSDLEILFSQARDMHDASLSLLKAEMDIL